MTLLIFYIVLALGVSFLCSVAEAVLLSVSSAYIAVLEAEGKGSGPLLRKLTEDINQPLSGILTLNTIAHTMGAAGAGAQATAIFGEAWMGLISALLTLAILIFSEIIPKTLGASYWRQLAPAVAYFLRYLVIFLYPFVKLSQWMTRGFGEDSPLRGLNRSEMAAMAELSRQEGQLAFHEATILKNLLKLDATKVKDAMTHRTVVFSLPQDMSVDSFFHQHSTTQFSRIPIYEQDDPEQITGFVLKSDLLLAKARGNDDKILADYRKDMVTVLSSIPLARTFDYFLDKRAHMMLAVDEYGGLEGVLTLEDLMENVLGVEIVDEKDKTISMKKLAQMMWKRRERHILEKMKE